MKANADKHCMRQKIAICTRASVPQATLDSTVRGKWINVPRCSALMVITLFSFSRSVRNISRVVGVMLFFFFETGGHCVGHGNLRLCSCRAGFTGSRCETNINECAKNPCANGSTCRDRINDYTCICPPGYTGRHCDKPTDRCASQPCLNGGTCTTGPKGQPLCFCPTHFSGPQCQSSSVPSPTTPSPNGGESGNSDLAPIVLGVGLVAVLVLACMAGLVIRHVRKRRKKDQDSETMNNCSKSDFQKENLLSTLEIKNNNKKVDLEVDCPGGKSNHKHINHYQLDYKASMGYKDELSFQDKDENCEKIGAKKHLSRMYR